MTNETEVLETREQLELLLGQKNYRKMKPILEETEEAEEAEEEDEKEKKGSL